MYKTILKSFVISTGLLASFFILPASVKAALTVGSTSVVSDGAITLNGAAGSNALFGTTATTGSISMGTALTTGNYTVGGTSQTGDILIGRSTQNNYIKIGSGIPASGKVTVVEIAKSDGVSGSNYLVEIANGLGSSSGVNRTVNIATGGTAGVSIGNTQTGSSLLMQAGATGNIWLNTSSSAYLWLGGFSQTGETLLGLSSATNTISIGNANTSSGNTQTINIGAGTPAGTGKALITIGNTVGASNVSIKSGTGGVNITGNMSLTDGVIVYDDAPSFIGCTPSASVVLSAGNFHTVDGRFDGNCTISFSGGKTGGIYVLDLIWEGAFDFILASNFNQSRTIKQVCEAGGGTPDDPGDEVTLLVRAIDPSTIKIISCAVNTAAD